MVSRRIKCRPRCVNKIYELIKILIIETDVLYQCYFPAMINDWRQKWYEGTQKQTKMDFPFGFVQVSYNVHDSIILVVENFLCFS